MEAVATTLTPTRSRSSSSALSHKGCGSRRTAVLSLVSLIERAAFRSKLDLLAAGTGSSAETRACKVGPPLKRSTGLETRNPLIRGVVGAAEANESSRGGEG